MGNVSTSVTNIAVVGDNNSVIPTTSITPTVSVTTDATQGINPTLVELTQNELRDFMDLTSSIILYTQTYGKIPEHATYELVFSDEQEEESDEDVPVSEVDNLVVKVGSRGFGLTPRKKGSASGGSIITGKMGELVSKCLATALTVGANKLKKKVSNSKFGPILDIFGPRAYKLFKEIWDQGGGNDVNKVNPTVAMGDTTVNVPGTEIDERLDMAIGVQPYLKLSPRGYVTPGFMNMFSSEISALPQAIFGTDAPEIGTTTIRNSNNVVYTSTSDAVGSMKKQVSISILVDGLAACLRIMNESETSELNAQSALMAMTGSTPNILVTPTNNYAMKVLSSQSDSLKNITSDQISLAGGSFGFAVVEQGSNASSLATSNFIQNVADTSVVNNEGMLLKQLRMNKLQYFNDFANHGTEVLLCLPNQTAQIDIPAVTYVDKLPYTEVLDSFDFKYLTAYAELSGTPTGYTGRLGNATSISADHLDDVGKVNIMFIFPDGFTLSEIYSSYALQLVFTLAMTTKAPNATPGLLVSVPSHSSLVFIPAKPSDSPRIWNTSVSLSQLGGNAFTTIHNSAKNVLFTPAIMGPASSSNVTLAIVNGFASGNKMFDSSNIPHYIFDREPAYEPPLNYLFTSLPSTRLSSSPLDVQNIWSKFVGRFGPRIDTMLAILSSSDQYKGALTNLRLQLINAQTSEALADQRFADDSVVEMWVTDALRDMPLWMLWRGGAPFYYLKKGFIPAIAHLLISLANALACAAIYSESSTSTLAGARSMALSYVPKDTNVAIKSQHIGDFVGEDDVSRSLGNVEFSRKLRWLYV